MTEIAIDELTKTENIEEFSQLIENSCSIISILQSTQKYDWEDFIYIRTIVVSYGARVMLGYFGLCWGGSG
jgi:hypothetical protein